MHFAIQSTFKNRLLLSFKLWFIIFFLTIMEVLATGYYLEKINEIYFIPVAVVIIIISHVPLLFFYFITLYLLNKTRRSFFVKVNILIMLNLGLAVIYAVPETFFNY